MHAGKDRDRRPAIDRLDVIDDEGDGEINPSIRERLRKFLSRGLDIGDFREALGTQQAMPSLGADREAVPVVLGQQSSPSAAKRSRRRRPVSTTSGRAAIA
jgi:hypothetical protein